MVLLVVSTWAFAFFSLLAFFLLNLYFDYVLMKFWTARNGFFNLLQKQRFLLNVFSLFDWYELLKFSSQYLMTVFKFRGWSYSRKRSYMEGGEGKGLGCQKTMDGKESNKNGSAGAIPSCCLKARASAPELDAKCHSTVVSGWFSESQSTSGYYLQFFFKSNFFFSFFV